MMTPTAKNIIKVFKKYPKGMIYYHDNGGWVYYKDGKLAKKLLKSENEEAQDELDALEVLSESDDDAEGYCSSLVIAFSTILGIETESV